MSSYDHRLPARGAARAANRPSLLEEGDEQTTLGNAALSARSAVGQENAEGSEAPAALADGLHFFPSEHRLVYVVGGQTLLSVEARGGPEAAPTHSEEAMPPGPTNEGQFLVAGTEAYNTPSWSWSKLDWGVPLIDKGSDVWYQLPSGKYGSVQRDLGLGRQQILDYHRQLYGSAEVPKTWVFNDFGPKAVRYFRDKNGDGKRNADEPLEGEMIHTTPKNEAETARGQSVPLDDSHGCIHIRPVDRESLDQVGAFAAGVAFRVHPYKAPRHS